MNFEDNRFKIFLLVAFVMLGWFVYEVFSRVYYFLKLFTKW